MLSRYQESPGKHAGIKTSASSGNIHKGAASTDTAEHCLQMRVFTGRRGPLHISQIGAPGHTHIAVTPGLPGNPGKGIVPVLHFVVHGQPFAFAVLPAPYILDHHGIAPLDKTKITGNAHGFSIWGADQHGGNLLGS